MQKLAELCVRRPVLACVLILLLVVVGAAGFFQLGVDRYPNVDFANVSVTTVQPGASARTIESEVTDKIEEAVNTVSGIDEVRSSSAEGVSIVNVQFVLEKNGDVAAQEVRDRVSRVVGELPRGIDPPVIEKFDASAVPVLSVALSSDKKTLRELSEFADKYLRRRLESLSGVGRVDVLGGTARQINVWADAYAMRSLDLSVTDITRVIESQNLEVPGGRIDQGTRESTLRTEGRVAKVSDFEDLRLRASTAGGIVRLRDVARVEDGAAEVSSVSELNGTPTVTLQLTKQSGANTVALVHAIEERLEELRPGMERDGYRFRLVNDQAEYIEASIHAVEEHLIVGSALAVGVVLVFLLSWRSALIAGVAVPASLVATFGLMWAVGFTLNTLTLLALTLAVGIVIDDAIVVLENVYRHIEEKGADPFTAAIEGTREIGLAVLATTLSLVAVFAPVAFMKGIVGRFMNSFGLTMAFAIIVSLLVAFTLTPMMSARLLRPSNAPRKMGRRNACRKYLRAPWRRVLSRIDDVYLVMLRWSMGHRWAIVLACVLALGSIPFCRCPPARRVPAQERRVAVSNHAGARPKAPACPRRAASRAKCPQASASAPKSTTRSRPLVVAARTRAATALRCSCA
jgi:HAE1 family hydrophobic/amphiphilic exporter-1